MLKSTFSNLEPKWVTYRDYEKFFLNNFKASLDNA